MTETQEGDPETLERIADSCHFYEPDLTDVQRRLRSSVLAHPIRRLPMHMDCPISSTYDFTAPRRTFAGQDTQRDLYVGLGLRGGYVRSWSGQYEHSPATLQVLLLELGDADIATGYIARQASSSDELADLDGRVNTRDVSGTNMTTAWLSADAVAFQVQGRGAAIGGRVSPIARDLYDKLSLSQAARY
jgi:hypothetical protein